MNKSLWSLLSNCIKDPKLRASLIANLLYYHNDPKTMSLLYFSAAQGSYLKGGSHYIQGGSQVLSNYLAGVIQKNGGEILYKHLVTKIITSGNTALGVEYIPRNSEGTMSMRVMGKHIIANSAIPNVANDLLPGKEGLRLRNKIRNLQVSSSALSIYLIFNRPPKEFGVNHHSTFIMEPGKYGCDDIKVALRADFNTRIFTFTDYGQMDAGLTPEGKYFGVILSLDYINEWEELSPEEYKAKKEEVANIFIERLNKVYPGIKDHIEYTEMATAKTVKRYILTPGGAIYGYAQTIKQAVPRRLSNKSPVKNLYFASSWVFPGGGFSGAIISGYNCSRYIK